jgi:hypothetical protein
VGKGLGAPREYFLALFANNAHGTILSSIRNKCSLPRFYASIFWVWRFSS